ncbi:MAG: ABC transporter permease subunit [Alphaproteobacteria bacterium]|nr:MAG: ABC transporter permease subunit [Alphaproteobacteria bacterium]
MNPLTVKKLRRFRQIKRGYYSFLLIIAFLVISAAAPLLVGNRALFVKYDGELFTPVFTAFHPGTDFGFDYSYEVNYRDLADRCAAEPELNCSVIMPLVPYSPYEMSAYEGVFKPEPPNTAQKHYLGTDTTGRDILARLFYGTRIAFVFAIAFMLAVYAIGVAIGCMMGYFGGLFDLILQRLIEIWSNIPFLYMVIIVFSVIPSTFSIPTRIAILLLVLVLFSWTSMTYYMRTATYKEKERDYTAAARILGASTSRIIFRHILPNTISTLVTFAPFTIVSAITSITALDFLGYGLPVPTPSLGELLKQGTATLRTAPWIVASAFGTLVVILTLVTFVGEAVRESFDPKKFTIYQ